MLVAFVLAGCVLVSIIAANVPLFGKLSGRDVVIIWLYDLLVLFIVDFFKVSMYEFLGENAAVLPDEEIKPSEPLEDEEEEVESFLNEGLPESERMSIRQSA